MRATRIPTMPPPFAVQPAATDVDSASTVTSCSVLITVAWNAEPRHHGSPPPYHDHRGQATRGGPHDARGRATHAKASIRTPTTALHRDASRLSWRQRAGESCTRLAEAPMTTDSCTSAAASTGEANASQSHRRPGARSGFHVPQCRLPPCAPRMAQLTYPFVERSYQAPGAGSLESAPHGPGTSPPRRASSTLHAPRQ